MNVGGVKGSEVSQEPEIYFTVVIHNLDILSHLEFSTYLKVDLATLKIDRDTSYFWSYSEVSDILDVLDATFQAALHNGGPDVMKMFQKSYMNLYKLMKRYEGYEGAKERIDEIQMKYHKYVRENLARETYSILNGKVERAADDVLYRTRSYFMGREKAKHEAKKKRDSLNFKWELHRLLHGIEQYQLNDDLKEACSTIRMILKGNQSKEPDAKNRFREEIQDALKKLKTPEVVSTPPPLPPKKKVNLVNSYKMVDVTAEELLQIKKNLKAVVPREKPVDEESDSLVTPTMLKEAKMILNKTPAFDELITKEQEEREPVLDLNVLTPLMADHIADRYGSIPDDDLAYEEFMDLDPKEALIFIFESMMDRVSQLTFDVSSDESSESWTSDDELEVTLFEEIDDEDPYGYTPLRETYAFSQTYVPLPEFQFQDVILSLEESPSFAIRRKQIDNN
ncbi:MAG: hypothetical protein K940chlam3_00402 [Chlamydiae bacterium]|nr:hypothetical protein [Chlamydiota bacterium]